MFNLSYRRRLVVQAMAEKGQLLRVILGEQINRSVLAQASGFGSPWRRRGGDARRAVLKEC